MTQIHMYVQCHLGSIKGFGLPVVRDHAAVTNKINAAVVKKLVCGRDRVVKILNMTCNVGPSTTGTHSGEQQNKTEKLGKGEDRGEGGEVTLIIWIHQHFTIGLKASQWNRNTVSRNQTARSFPGITITEQTRRY